MTNGAEDLLVEAPPARPGRGGLARIGRGLARQPAALSAGVILALVFVAGLIVPTLAPHGSQIHLEDGAFNRPPTLSGWHLMGTTGLGQDVLLRSVQGLHASEQIAVFGTIVATFIGVAVGAVAAYRGGWVDAALMRFADMLGIPPAIFVLLVLYFNFRPVTPLKASLILACLLWIPVARVVRAEVVSLRSREFVQAAVSLGATDRRIFFRHLLPNLGSTIVVAGTTLFGQLIMLEATVEFFRVSESETSQPTLGGLIGFGKVLGIQLNYGWWTWAGPAFILVVVLVCANLVGDGVAEALRPNSRR